MYIQKKTDDIAVETYNLQTLARTKWLTIGPNIEAHYKKYPSFLIEQL